ncbi:glycosyltransferase [Allosediminivita pacifica]|uniref:glycosyltransferase n=1 Tax=Allosediminivita pacifica TaxID=1267769 RepID=UPI001304EA99|nr:glycosyltransferase family 2 protein [Allosediminivita pacifica]GGB07858.1 hypothetical protein GCM10011324_17550 [Allosediminivita pacifica]
MTGKTRIGIGAITRRRPQMFSDLLDSFAWMRVPEGVELVYLFAENDDETTMTGIVEGFAERTGAETYLELETRQGIPMARNRVLDMALADGCDFLTFVDDDETVDRDWLVQLYDTISGEELDLVGGPVRYQPPQGSVLSRENRAVLDVVQGRSGRDHAKRSERARTHEGHRVAVYTNNWIARLSRVRELGVRFDEAARFTGGSDTKFYKDFREAGGRTGWAPGAYVCETRPLSRLTYRYYYERCRDQEMTRLGRKDAKPSALGAYAVYLYALLRSALYLAKSPFTAGRGKARAMRVMGQASARVGYLRGRQSDHYDPSRAHLHEDPQGKG